MRWTIRTAIYAFRPLCHDLRISYKVSVLSTTSSVAGQWPRAMLLTQLAALSSGGRDASTKRIWRSVLRQRIIVLFVVRSLPRCVARCLPLGMCYRDHRELAFRGRACGSFPVE
jgi:hypothetical protein